MEKCLNCGRGIGMDIMFGGNTELRLVGLDGDGFTCSNKCHTEYQNKVNTDLDNISKMTDEEFASYMMIT